LKGEHIRVLCCICNAPDSKDLGRFWAAHTLSCVNLYLGGSYATSTFIGYLRTVMRRLLFKNNKVNNKVRLLRLFGYN
ncbi:hypothetical protein, partial [Domibacillus tundrae]|uniref:hypothetical protein n=1 Tax=Domibacillus tundrae TaxID=1587527 RepID=UPI001C10404A